MNHVQNQFRNFMNSVLWYSDSGEFGFEVK